MAHVEHCQHKCLGKEGAEARHGLGCQLDLEAARALTADLLGDAVGVRDADIGALELVDGEGGARAPVEELLLETDLNPVCHQCIFRGLLFG